ncbi:unnamed protein product, partial [Discosporangium mesarthrocarpum]
MSASVSFPGGTDNPEADSSARGQSEGEASSLFLKASCSPNSSCGSRGSFEPNGGSGLEAFMEALGSLSPQDAATSSPDLALRQQLGQAEENGLKGGASSNPYFTRKRRAPLEGRELDAPGGGMEPDRKCSTPGARNSRRGFSHIAADGTVAPESTMEE